MTEATGAAPRSAPPQPGPWFWPHSPEPRADGVRLICFPHAGGGQAIDAGEAVTVWMPSANRDAAVFEAPDRFDVMRTPNQHLAFGTGAHYCLGSAFARAELRVLFTELFRNASGVELVGPVRRLRSNLIWGYESLPVRLHPLPDR